MPYIEQGAWLILEVITNNNWRNGMTDDGRSAMCLGFCSEKLSVH